MKTNPLITIVVLALAVFLYTCSAEDNSPGGGVSLPKQFSVANLPRSTDTFPSTTFVPDNYRTHFVSFSIGTELATEGEYRLGLKEKSKDVPTVNDLTSASAAITRTLSSNKINIYLPFHIEGTYFDTDATQDYATALATALSPATSYTLYITPADGSGTVEQLQNFTTDPVPNYTGTGIYNLPRPGYDYTLRTDEPFYLYIKARSDNTVTLAVNGEASTSCDAEYNCVPRLEAGYTYLFGPTESYWEAFLTVPLVSLATNTKWFINFKETDATANETVSGKSNFIFQATP